MKPFWRTVPAGSLSVVTMRLLSLSALGTGSTEHKILAMTEKTHFPHRHTLFHISFIPLIKSMTKQKLGAIILILILGFGNAYLFLKQNETQRKLQATEAGLTAADTKVPIIEFNQLFVDKVLRAEGEVSFDTRLELENKVRNLNDAEMLEQWNAFVNADTEQDAQTEVKKLLGLLAQRMKR